MGYYAGYAAAFLLIFTALSLRAVWMGFRESKEFEKRKAERARLHPELDLRTDFETFAASHEEPSLSERVAN